MQGGFGNTIGWIPRRALLPRLSCLGPRFGGQMQRSRVRIGGVPGEYDTISVQPFESDVRVRFYRQENKAMSIWGNPPVPEAATGPFLVPRGSLKTLRVPPGATHALIAYSPSLPFPKTLDNLNKFERPPSVAKSPLSQPCYESIKIVPATASNYSHKSFYICK